MLIRGWLCMFRRVVTIATSVHTATSAELRAAPSLPYVSLLLLEWDLRGQQLTEDVADGADAVSADAERAGGVAGLRLGV